MLEFKNRLLLLQILFRTRFCTFILLNLLRQGALSIMGPQFRGAMWWLSSYIWYLNYSINLDIFFGIWTTVYWFVLIFPKPTIFLAPFYKAGVHSCRFFFFQNASIWSNQNICWQQDKSVNNCTLYLNYQAVCLLLDILTGKRGSHDYHAISFSYENHAKIRWKVSHVNVFAWYSHENCTIVSHFCLFS